LLFAQMAPSLACTSRRYTTRTGTLLRSCRAGKYGPAAIMSIAYVDIVSPLASMRHIAAAIRRAGSAQ
jgi:hypothetical protein